MTAEDPARFQYEPENEPPNSTRFTYQAPANRFQYIPGPSTVTPLKPTGHWLSVCVPIFLDKVDNLFDL